MKGREDKNERQKWTDRTLAGRTTEGAEMMGGGGNEWAGVGWWRMRSDRRDYSKSSSSSTKCQLITFPTISPNRPSQNCKTTNNIRPPLSQSLRYMWDTELQLRLSWPQIKYFNRLWFRLVCTSSKNLDLGFSAHVRPKKSGGNWWPLQVSAPLIVWNTKENKRSAKQSRVIY